MLVKNKRNKVKVSSSVTTWLLSALCIVAVVFAVYNLVPFWRARQTTQQLPNASQVVNHDTDTPSEQKPDPNVTYKVAADKPRKISIPGVNVEGYIQLVGTTPEKRIAVPNNIHFAGWFVSSSPPGQKGNSIIDGHVSGRYADAIFKNLQKVQRGQTIDIQMGDESTIHIYSVVSVQQVPEAQSQAAIFDESADGGKALLTLITCGGSFDKKTEQFADRIIVKAALQN